jgi:uncharacterized membrane protein (UPF0127 family)
MKRLARTALVVTAAACSGGHEPTVPACSTAATSNVAFADGTVAAEIAATSAARETGLMNRSLLCADSGMLFVFPFDQQVGPGSSGFWMKNTLINLSIAFMDSTKHVVGVQEMVALDTVNFHRPNTSYRYALEANAGWFTSHNIAVGAIATFTLPSGTIPTR